MWCKPYLNYKRNRLGITNGLTSTIILYAIVTLNLFQGLYCKKDADHEVATRQLKTLFLLVK
ncbi:hypothetical protein QFZ20_001217 [Flavobacterium sp. W4I14]|nr:hypothetical protein [Flavobacterium sp. W4I14]